ncbi:MAG: pteridine reductase [Legionellaceae bacterium]|nr:pteridine reductase [Legionellaceae bacterium]
MNRDNTQAGGVALVTAAARRIGASIAKALHAEGFDVVLHCYQSTKEAHLLAAELNHARADSAYVCEADLCLMPHIKKLVDTAYHWKRRLDVLVNNASNFIKTPIGTFDESVWEALWGLNVKAPFLLSEAAFPYLKQSGDGNIVNVTDVLAEHARAEYAVYVQTKAALKRQTEALAIEYAPSVRVNAVAPGATIVPEGDNALTSSAYAEILASIPLKRWGAPEGVAMAVKALATNAYITGQTLRVDGGQSLI